MWRGGPRGGQQGPYKVGIHIPKRVLAADPRGRHFTPGQYSLSEREREIAVERARGGIAGDGYYLSVCVGAGMMP